VGETLPLTQEHENEEYLPYLEPHLYNEVMNLRRETKGSEDK
jgi:hypothetical protein